MCAELPGSADNGTAHGVGGQASTATGFTPMTNRHGANKWRDDEWPSRFGVDKPTFEALLAKIEPDLVGYYEETLRARVPLHRCSVTHAPTSIELQRPAGGLRRTAPLPGTARHSPSSTARHSP